MANPGDDARRLLIEREKAKQLAVLNEFKKIRDRLSLDIFDLMKRIEHARQTEGNSPPGLLIQKARLNALLDQVSDEIRSASTRLGIIAEQSQRTAIQIAKTENGKFAALRTDLTFFDSAATRELIGVAGNGEPLDLVFARLAPFVKQRVVDALIYGIAAGKANEIIAREIGQAIGTGAAGAMTIVRTETNRAYREATRKFYDDAPDIIGWRWLAALDLRTCPICWALHGSIFPTSEKMATHPNCRCTMTPVFPGDAKRETGPDRFAKLNSAQQKAILGPERLKLYNAGANLSDFVELHSTPFGPGRRLHPLVNIDFTANPRTPAPRPFPNAGPVAPPPASRSTTTPKTTSFAPGDPVPDFESWDDAETYFEQRFPSTKFDFGLMDVRALNTSTKEIARLFDKYPEVAGQMKYVGTYENRNKWSGSGSDGKFTKGAFAHAQHPDRGPGFIAFNPSWFRDMAGLESALKRSQKIGWLNQGSVESVFTHEFGHATDGYLTKTIGRNRVVPFSYVEGKATTIRDLKKAVVKKFKPKPGEVSDYADTDIYERFAESFAQMEKSDRRSRLADALEKLLQFTRDNETFDPGQQIGKDWFDLTDQEQRDVRRRMNEIYDELGLTKPFKKSET